MSKKKSIAFILTVTVLISVIGCGKAEKGPDAAKEDKNLNVAEVKINNKQYDLTEDMHSVIGNMVSDGLYVRDANSMRYFNSEGNVDSEGEVDLSSTPDDDLVYVLADRSQLFEGDFQYNAFLFGNNYVEYSNGDGIDTKSSSADFGKLDGYYPYYGYFNRLDDGYVAVYFDDKQVNLDEYDESLEDFLKNDYKRSEISFGVNTVTSGFYDLSSPDEDTSKYAREEVPVVNAVLQGCEMIDAGKLEHIYVVWYTCCDDDDYNLFSFFIIDKKN